MFPMLFTFLVGNVLAMFQNSNGARSNKEGMFLGGKVKSSGEFFMV